MADSITGTNNETCHQVPGEFARGQMGVMVLVRWYFPYIFKGVTEIKYYGLCQHVNTCKMQKGQENLHPISLSQGMESDWH